MEPKSEEESPEYFRDLGADDVARNVRRDKVPERPAIIDRAPQRAAHERNLHSDLQRLARWHILLFVAWASLIPAEMIIGNPLSNAIGSSTPFFLVAFVLMGLFTYSGIRIGLFRCPRCQKRYTSKPIRGLLFYGNPFTSKCLHCGLQRSS